VLGALAKWAGSSDEPAPEPLDAATTYPLEAVNEALDDLPTGRLTGAAVVIPQQA
jgi:hypothetical protein